MFLVGDLLSVLSFQGEQGVRGPPGPSGPRGIGTQGPKVSPRVSCVWAAGASWEIPTWKTLSKKYSQSRNFEHTLTTNSESIADSM